MVTELCPPRKRAADMDQVQMEQMKSPQEKLTSHTLVEVLIFPCESKIHPW